MCMVLQEAEKQKYNLQLAARCLSRGQGVLYLVPEIALTYQLFAHIHGRFSSLAAMLHSGLTVSERLENGDVFSVARHGLS